MFKFNYINLIIRFKIIISQYIRDFIFSKSNNICLLDKVHDIPDLHVFPSINKRFILSFIFIISKNIILNFP